MSILTATLEREELLYLTASLGAEKMFGTAQIHMPQEREVAFADGVNKLIENGWFERDKEGAMQTDSLIWLVAAIIADPEYIIHIELQVHENARQMMTYYLADEYIIEVSLHENGSLNIMSLVERSEIVSRLTMWLGLSMQEAVTFPHIPESMLAKLSEQIKGKAYAQAEQLLSNRLNGLAGQAVSLLAHGTRKAKIEVARTVNPHVIGYYDCLLIDEGQARWMAHAAPNKNGMVLSSFEADALSNFISQALAQLQSIEVDVSSLPL